MSILEKGILRDASFVVSSPAQTFVDWDDNDDPDNPLNWRTGRKIGVIVSVCSIVFVLTFASSVFAPAINVTAAEYNVSSVIMSLGVALFIAGFTLGPLFFGPLSEMVGHMVPLCVGLSAVAIFEIPLGLASNVATILVSRLLAGAIGGGLLSVGSGMFVHVYEPITRGIVVALSATMLNFGSVIGPIAGTYLVHGPGWRWTAWITLIMSGIAGIIAFLCLHETSPRIILRRKAQRLRRETGDQSLRAKSEVEAPSITLLVNKYLEVPVKMFFQEPILIILTVYLTLTYGTLYLSYQMFPFAFKKRGWSETSAYLPFISVALGVAGSWSAYSIFMLTWYKRRFLSGQTTPEDRLPPMIMGGAILPPALLWFGWSQQTHPVSQIVACFFIGFSLVLIFLSGIVYIVDVYAGNANSAVTIHVVVRSVFAATFPLWSTPMYERLGVEWSATLLAGLSVIMVPFPVVFWFCGHRIRSWSRFALSAD